MLPLYSAQQIRALDATAIGKYKIPGLILMENASINIVNAIKKHFHGIKNNSVFCILCGKGNNGGDGFAVARHLLNCGFVVHVIHLYPANEFSGDALSNFQILQNLAKEYSGLTINELNIKKLDRLFKQSDFIIDAILGSGSKGNLESPLDEIVKMASTASARRIALDIPTGVNADTGYSTIAFKADLTISLAGPKQGLYFSNGYLNSGLVLVEGIGIPEFELQKYQTSAYLVEKKDILPFFTEKPKNIHKYSSGRLVVIAGSVKYPGAAFLTARSAFRAGCGAVVLAIPKQIQLKYPRNFESHLVYSRYGKESTAYLEVNHLDELKTLLDRADSVILGPGLGDENETLDALELIFNRYYSKNLIVDADALKVINRLSQRTIKKCKNIILTPHMGEFAEMTGLSNDEIRKDLPNIGKEISAKFQCVLVLKDFRSITFSPQGMMFVNSTGNPGMAKFGFGDVLAGVIGSLSAQKNTCLNSAYVGVYLHSYTADILKQQKTEFGYTASDLTEYLPFAIKKLRQND